MILFAVCLIASVLALAVLRPTEPGYQSDDWMTIYPFARDMASKFFTTLFPDGGGSPYLLLPVLPIIYLGAHGVRILLAVWPDSTGRHQLRLVKLPLFAMMAAGLIGGMLLRSRWGEEGYFVHYGAIPMVLIAAGSVDAVRRAYRTRRFKLLRIGLVVVLFGTFLETAVNVIGAFSWFYRSAPMYVDVINEDRYEVYRWLREHTQVNEVITTLPRSAMDYSSSSLSERRVLIGGWYYISSARRWNSGGFYASDAIEQNPGERTAADMEHALQVGDSNRIITLMRRAGSKHIVLLKSDYARIAETGAFTLVHRNGSYAAFSVSSDTVRQK